jgi:hypothetical protein
MAESEAFPWINHLPEDEQTSFFLELEEAFGTALFDVCPGVAPTAQDFINRVDPIVRSWKATAEVHADPEILKALTTVHEVDFGEAPRPEPCGAILINTRHLTGSHECTKGVGHEGEHLSKHGRRWS